MDEGASQEMTETEPRKEKHHIFSTEDAIICKGCHKMHYLDDFAIQMRGITFPKGDLSVYRIGCPESNEFYEYSYKDDIMKPTAKIEEERRILDSVNSDTEARFKAIESRLSWLESVKWLEARKQDLEDFARHFLTEQVKTMKGQPVEEKKKPTVAYTT